MSSVLHDTLMKCRPTLKWSETIRRWYPERNSGQFCNDAKAKFCICGPQKVGICTLLQTFWGSGPVYHLKLLWRAAKHLMKTYNSSHLQKTHEYICVQLLVGLLNICYCYCCIPLCPTGSKSGGTLYPHSIQLRCSSSILYSLPSVMLSRQWFSCCRL